MAYSKTLTVLFAMLIGIVMKGEILVGIISSLDSGNKLCSRVVRAGETFLIPRGLMHFQFNVGKAEASMFVSFNSENPSIIFVPRVVRLEPTHPDAGAHQGATGGRPGVVELLKSKFACGS